MSADKSVRFGQVLKEELHQIRKRRGEAARLARWDQLVEQARAKVLAAVKEGPATGPVSGQRIHDLVGLYLDVIETGAFPPPAPNPNRPTPPEQLEQQKKLREHWEHVLKK